MPYSILDDSEAQLLCDLAAQFYTLGWNLGTGGGLSLQHDSIILLTPSGVPKERMKPSDLFAYDTEKAEYVWKPDGKKVSASTDVFLYLHSTGAGAVIHTHSIYSNLASRRDQFEVRDQEYIKGIPFYSTGKMRRNTDTLTVPIIKNQETEDLLLADIKHAVREDPDTCCILVKNHGAYHFGRDIWKCKAQAECLEYLFELDWKMRSTSD